MAKATSSRHRSQFDVAIICALRTESDAVEAVFDEFFDSELDNQCLKSLNDSNAYTLGRIGVHHVVLVYLPDMGKISSASASANLHRSYPNIRLGFVVGVCGGLPYLPNGHDSGIHLGDVIVSTSVTQLDLGRQNSDKFVRKDTLRDSLGRPNAEIRAYLNQIQGWRSRSALQQNLLSTISDVTRDEYFRSWTRPSSLEDKVFDAAYRHKHQEPADCVICSQCTKSEHPVCDEALRASCAELCCDVKKVIQRKRGFGNPAEVENDRKSTQVHFGGVGSSDSVVKSAQHRDTIATQAEVIAFEMEGAGAWDNFPTVVIKGVSDYADSHKSKDWQKYASVAAAACARALLYQWHGVARPDTEQDHLQETPRESMTDGRDTTSSYGVKFVNYGNVKNQAGTQIFHGSVHF